MSLTIVGLCAFSATLQWAAFFGRRPRRESNRQFESIIVHANVDILKNSIYARRFLSHGFLVILGTILGVMLIVFHIFWGHY